MVSTVSTAYSSGFSDGAESHTWSDQTSIPAHDPHQQVPFMNQLHLPTHVAGAPRPHETLWCEHSGTLGCPFTCRLDDRESWIQHHVEEHLGGYDAATFPAQMKCWFCNILFEVRSPGGGYDCFRTRMEHIWQDIFDDARLTADRMLPDFHMVEHMYQMALLPEQSYRAAMSYSEIELPGEAEQLYASASAPTTWPHWPASSSRKKNEVVHDLDKERREEKKRRQQQKGKAPEKKRK